MKLGIGALDAVALRRVVCIGDSHTRVFAYPTFKLWFPLTRFDVTTVMGATASGLENPRSKTQAGRFFAEALEKSNDDTPVVLLLGEVDTGFVIWWRAARYGSPVEGMMGQSVDNYISLIQRAASRAPTMVVSAPLPTIRDGSQIGDVANLRSCIDVSQTERTSLALAFNQRVKERCAGIRNVDFLDLDPASLDTQTGLVHTKLLSPRPGDHHYDRAAYATLIRPGFRRFLRKPRETREAE